MATKQRSQMSTPKAVVKTVAHASATIKPKAVSKIANTDVRIGAQKPVTHPAKVKAGKPVAKPVKKPAAKPAGSTINGRPVNNGVALAPLNSYDNLDRPVTNGRQPIPASQFTPSPGESSGYSKSDTTTDHGNGPNNGPPALTNGMIYSGSDEQNIPIDPTPKPMTAHAAIRKPGKHPSVKSTNPTGTHATSTAKHGATRIASPGGIKHPKASKPVHGALIGQVADTSNFAPHPDLNTVSEDTAGSTDLPSDSADAFGGGINGRTQSSGHQHVSPVSGWGDSSGDTGGSGDGGDATDNTPMASEPQAGGGMISGLSSIPMGVWIAVAGAGILILIVALKGK